MSGYNFKKKYCILLSEDRFTFTNSVDPADMQHNAAFHLGLYYLQKYSFWGFPNTKYKSMLSYSVTETICSLNFENTEA